MAGLRPRVPPDRPAWFLPAGFVNPNRVCRWAGFLTAAPSAGRPPDNAALAAGLSGQYQWGLRACHVE